MDTIEIENVIREWFRVNMAGNLRLPNGWYGRPYDCQHWLTKIEAAGDIVEIEFDNIMYLKFLKLSSVTQKNGTLVLSEFETLVFTAPPGSMRYRDDATFSDGEVRIYAP